MLKIGRRELPRERLRGRGIFLNGDLHKAMNGRASFAAWRPDLEARERGFAGADGRSVHEPLADDVVGDQPSDSSLARIDELFPICHSKTEGDASTPPGSRIRVRVHISSGSPRRFASLLQRAAKPIEAFPTPGQPAATQERQLAPSWN
jgi:hypothetical protein